MRQIALDTETTGLSTKNGDRIIEIGCVEIIDRVITGKTFHSYINPECQVGTHTIAITGIKDEFLLNKPKFVAIVDDFLKFIDNAELIIHNAVFDVEFINNELRLLNHEIQDISQKCKIIDTLVLARTMHPGQRNNLDALCKRYKINTERALHGALLDANILAKLILKMTAGQISLNFDLQENITANLTKDNKNADLLNARSYKNKNINMIRDKNLKIIYANLEETNLHEKYIQELLQVE